MYLFKYRITNCFSRFDVYIIPINVYLSVRIDNKRITMKNLIVSVILLFSTQLMAQESKLKAEAADFAQKEDKLILFFSSDNWTNLPSEITSKPFRSRGFSFQFMNEVINKSGNFGLGIGFGFMSQNVHTDGDIIFDTTATESYSMLEKIPDSLDYNLNKLSLNFITLALEIRLRTSENKHGERFKFSAGILAGVLLQSHTKYSDDEQKFKTYKVKNLNDIQYGLTGRIGYSNYAISGYYSLVNVFEDGRGIELTPYSVGISFTF